MRLFALRGAVSVGRNDSVDILGSAETLMRELMDRNELEAQLFGNLEAVGFGNVEVAETKRHLLRLLREDRRGLIVSTIHKFDDVPANANTIFPRASTPA